jgi:hypothetical protein
MSKTYKAFIIDVEKREVREIQVGDSCASWYDIIGGGCHFVSTCGISFGDKDGIVNDLMVDDNGLYGDHNGCFFYPDWIQPIMGNALIVGADKYGNTAHANCTIEEISKGLRFLGEDITRAIRERMM